jgi:hypothetical protein
MKRFSVILMVVGVALILPFAAVEAAQTHPPPHPNQPAPPLASARSFDVAVDVGLPVAGFIPYGKLSGSHGLDGTLSGIGSVSFPYFGLHARAYPSPSWYIQMDLLNYSHQTGTGTWTFKNKDTGNTSKQDMTFVVNRLNVIDFGIGKMLATGRVRPNAGFGLGVHYVSFADEHAHDSAAGWAVGPFGQLGVDITATKIRRVGDLFFGVNLRLDLIWNWQDYQFDKSNSNLSMVYLPLSFFVSGGLRF